MRIFSTLDELVQEFTDLRRIDKKARLRHDFGVTLFCLGMATLPIPMLSLYWDGTSAAYYCSLTIFTILMATSIWGTTTSARIAREVVAQRLHALCEYDRLFAERLLANSMGARECRDAFDLMTLELLAWDRRES